MNKPNHALTKTCMSCGLQKPLSAFLQFSTTQGATYGNICVTCRKSQQTQPKQHEDSEEKTRREIGGSKIRASERLAGEVDKKQRHEKLETLYKEEEKKDEKQKLERTLKTETRVKSERSHRESYLEKRSFLDRTTDKTRRPESREQVFGGEAHRAKEAEVRLDAPIIGSMDREKYKTALFRQFKDWLGSNAPMVSAEERAQKSSSAGGAPPAAEKAAGTAKEPAKAQEKPEQESLADYVRQTWGPGSKRR